MKFHTRHYVRIDYFLNAINIVKTRSIAQDMIKNNVIFVNNNKVKASYSVKIGDIIELKFLDKTHTYEILKLPTTKSTPKSQKPIYAKEL